jgi:hypothetical protein
MAGRDFTNKVAELIEANPEKIEARMEKIGVDDMINLVDAVHRKDRDRVRKIIFYTPTEEVEEGAEDTAYEPSVGDPVIVGDESGIVKIAHGPNDTVGVMFDGKLRMVKKTTVKLEEGAVLGVPSLISPDRLRELAGIPVPITVAQAPCEASDALDQGPVAVDATAQSSALMTNILADLDAIARAADDLTLRDARTIRNKMQTVLAKLCESAAPKGK